MKKTTLFSLLILALVTILSSCSDSTPYSLRRVYICQLKNTSDTCFIVSGWTNCYDSDSISLHRTGRTAPGLGSWEQVRGMNPYKSVVENYFIWSWQYYAMPNDPIMISFKWHDLAKWPDIFESGYVVAKEECTFSPYVEHFSISYRDFYAYCGVDISGIESMEGAALLPISEDDPSLQENRLKRFIAFEAQEAWVIEQLKDIIERGELTDLKDYESKKHSE